MWVDAVTKPGFYWWRMSATRSPCPVEVIVTGEDKAGNAELSVLHREVFYALEKVGGEFWSAAILFPD